MNIEENTHTLKRLYPDSGAIEHNMIAVDVRRILRPAVRDIIRDWKYDFSAFIEKRFINPIRLIFQKPQNMERK
jgi:hypothetical protein